PGQRRERRFDSERFGRRFGRWRRGRAGGYRRRRRDRLRRRREKASTRAYLDTGPLHANGDRVELSIQLAGRVVAEQIVRTEIRDHAPESAGEIVRVDDREAIGRLGQRAQRRQSPPE